MRPSESSSQRSNRAVPRAPSSQSRSGTSDSTAPTSTAQESYIQQSKSIPEPTVSISRSVTTNHSVAPSAAVSIEKLPPSASDFPSLTGETASITNESVRRSNSINDQPKTPSKKDQMHSQPQLQSPLQVMHKATNKYEVCKVTDEEETQQRQLRAILNKLTPRNFEKLFEKVKEINIDNADTLSGVVSQIFDKALMVPTFCEMYANLCYYLAGELPDFTKDNEKITLKRLLLNKCQEEFERGEREQADANRVEEDGEVKQSEEGREEKKSWARRRMLGNVRLIGELYKKKMLPERIMHGYIIKLLGQCQNLEGEDIEALCKLMSTIGREMIDHPKAKEQMDKYFDIMANLSNNMTLSSRLRFMLKDAIDLRKNNSGRRRESVRRSNSINDQPKMPSKKDQRHSQPQLQPPLQVMHKATNKYEVCKVTDEEETQQRQLRAILNKLTPQNFEKLFEKVKEINIDNADTLSGVVLQIFDKALMVPTFCEIYANLCYYFGGKLPDFTKDNEKITFKRLLLNKCQEEFERGEREQSEANRIEEDGEVEQSEEGREEKKIQARRRKLGNIRLIGELYKKKMLTERIMHECIIKLLGQYQHPGEEDIEALCKLMSTIGEMIDHPKAKEQMDKHFDIMANLSNNMTLSSRLRFMLKDAIDLRKNKWQQRRKVESPKKIEEVDRENFESKKVKKRKKKRREVLQKADATDICWYNF